MWTRPKIALCFSEQLGFRNVFPHACEPADLQDKGGNTLFSKKQIMCDRFIVYAQENFWNVSFIYINFIHSLFIEPNMPAMFSGTEPPSSCLCKVFVVSPPRGPLALAVWCSCHSSSSSEGGVVKEEVVVVFVGDV